MVHSFAWFRSALSGVVLAAWFVVPAAAADAPLAAVEFNRDIRPILSDNCFFCHGPDAGHRQADPAAADSLLKSGFAPVPADIDKAELAAWSGGAAGRA